MSTHGDQRPEGTPARAPGVRDLIVLTGLPRSGTTPLGEALTEGTRIASLYEPLNAKSGDRRVLHYFTVPGAEIAYPAFDELVTDVQNLAVRLKPGLWVKDSAVRKAVKLVVGGRSRQSLRSARLSRPAMLLWKDPFALFALDRLAELGHRRLAVTFRKPAAIVASFQRLEWSFDLPDLQRRLAAAGMQVPGVQDLPPSGSRWVDNALQLYVMGYTYALDLHRRRPHVALVDNADLAQHRDELLAAIRSRFELPQPAPRRARRLPPVPRSRTKAYGRRAHAISRDLTRVNDYYTEFLSPAQVDLVESVCGPLHERLKAVAIRPTSSAPPDDLGTSSL